MSIPTFQVYSSQEDPKSRDRYASCHFKDDNAKELIVSFPGTAFIQDFVTDFSFVLLNQTTAAGCTNCRKHRRSIAEDVVTATLADLQTASPSYSTIISGHSLGGAIATLAYTDLNASGVSKTSTTGFSGALDSNLGTLIMITHNTDGVPGLPSQAMGFQHSRLKIYDLDNAAGT